MAAAEDGGEAYVPRLRVEARREYLKKREPQRLKLLEAEIQDEDFLFKGMELSEAEQAERALKKRMLEAARKRVNLSDRVEGVCDRVFLCVDDASALHTGYAMPEDEFDERGKLNKDAQLDKLRARYTGTDNEQFVIDAEQKEWEEAQMQRVQSAYGSKDAAAQAAAEAAGAYDYVFDAQIDFVKDLTAKRIEDEGDDALAPPPPKTAAEIAQREHATLQETRRSLPIYQYRDDLVQAVRDHQVCDMCCSCVRSSDARVRVGVDRRRRNGIWCKS
jgi:pre-mRNA-splicing factor ATP-dependent RNA helicase DHX16